MTFDFASHLIDHPEIVDTIPDGAELAFIDKDMPFKAKEHAKKKKVVRLKIKKVSTMPLENIKRFLGLELRKNLEE